jgi:hypothetical protein
VTTRVKTPKRASKAKDDIARKVAEHAGEGVSIRFTDQAYWLDSDPANQPWYEALHALDSRGDKEPLRKLLESDAVLTRVVRQHLSDLVGRGIKRPKGGQLTPSYAASDMDVTLALAFDAVRSMRARGVPRAEAITRAAATYRVDRRAVEQVCAGQRQSFQRSPARRLP